MVEKFAQEEFAHSFPFQLRKRDTVTFAEVKAYESFFAEAQSGVVLGPERVGYVKGATVTTFSLGENEEFSWAVRAKSLGRRDASREIIGSVSVLQTEPDKAEVQAWLKGGQPGKQYILVATIYTESGEKLMAVDTLYIKTL